MGRFDGCGDSGRQSCMMSILSFSLPPPPPKNKKKVNRDKKDTVGEKMFQLYQIRLVYTHTAYIL